MKPDFFLRFICDWQYCFIFVLFLRLNTFSTVVIKLKNYIHVSDQEALCDCVGRDSKRGGDPLHGYILENEESQNRPVRHIGGQTLQAVEE